MSRGINTNLNGSDEHVVQVETVAHRFAAKDIAAATANINK